MAVFFWVILGGLVGANAKSVLWMDRSEGWLPSILIGIAGAIAGGFIRGTVGTADGFDLASMGLTIVGAALLLSLYHLFVERKGATSTVHGERDRRAA